MGECIANCRAVVDNTVMVGCKAALFFGFGYASGHFLNYTVQTLQSSFFKKTFVNPWAGGICSGIFVVVDFLAKTLFEKVLGEDYAKRPLVVMARIALGVPVTVFFCGLEGLAITPYAALATIVCSIASYVFLQEVVKRY